MIEQLDEFRNQEKDPIDVAIELCMYCMKTQVFKDGDKRASVIFATRYLIAHGIGFLVIPEKDVPEFKKLLVGGLFMKKKYYFYVVLPVIAIILERLPLGFGFDFFSVVGALISTVLVLEFVIVVMNKNRG